MLVPRATGSLTFACLKGRYQFFANQRSETILLFPVGCFYEWYDKQVAQAGRWLGLRLLALGRGVWYGCGLPARLGSRCARALEAFWQPVARRPLAGTVNGGRLPRLLLCRAAFIGAPWAGVERGGSLFSDFDAIDEVGGLSEAGRRQVPVLFIVKHQPFSHHLRQL